MLAWGISHKRTRISWPAMCAKEERMERLRGLKNLDGNLIPKYKVKRLRIDPVRLNIKVGLKNCPNMRLVAKTLKILTHIAVLKLNRYKA
jgi:hypothetical protein